MMNQITHRLSLGIVAIALIPLLMYGGWISQRPLRLPTERSLFQGINYERRVQDDPRPLVIHIVGIDLTVPGVEIVASTDLALAPENGPAIARTTSHFLTDTQVQLAVNASFFYPFHEHTPWDYSPRSGDRVHPVGLAITNELTYSEPSPDWHPLCVLESSHLHITTDTTCPDTTKAAVAGWLLLVAGKPAVSQLPSPDKPYARLVVGTNADGSYVWLVAIDGKQPLYSQGMTLTEVTALMQQLGAVDALNLDGGGSTTLVQSTADGPQLLNAAVHTKWPMRERPVANHIGVKARPLTP
jgi:hypothetical protein